MRIIIRAARFAVIGFLAVLLFTGAAQADPDILYVSPDGQFSARAIGLTEADGRYYLFLPGNIERSRLKIGFAPGSEVTLNGKTATGLETAADLAERNEITIGQRKYTFDVMQGSKGLPALYITTETESLKQVHRSKKYKEAGFLTMTDGNGETVYDGALDHIKMRGNASTGYTKKNYQIKLETGTDMLGMGKAKKWILTGNWLDKSLIRNEMTYDLAEYIGMKYTPQRQQAELYINHEYIGLYLFSEKVEIQKSRIDIRDLEKETEKLNTEELSGYRKAVKQLAGEASYKAYRIPNDPEDITGGYLVEFEYIRSKYDQEPSGFRTKRNIGLVIKSPEYASEAQALYIYRFMQGFENAIFAADGIDPDTGKAYYEFVDINSLAMKYMINEFSQNYDGNSSSEFFYKPADSESGKAYAGPVWDMDNTYADYAQEYNLQQIVSPGHLFIGEANRARYWWPNIYKHREFIGTVQELYEGAFGRGVRIILGEEKDHSGILRSLDEYGAAIADSAAMNYARYPAMAYGTGIVQTGKNPEENIEYLRTFIRGRREYLEDVWFVIPEQ